MFYSGHRFDHLISVFRTTEWVKQLIGSLKTYLRMIIFATGILAGIQVPSFVEQYTQRVHAHLQEVRIIFAGYQQTADRFFDGSIEKLLHHYQTANDAVFNADARTIEHIRGRLVRLSTELAALERPLAFRIIHVLFNADKALLHESITRFTYTVPLQPRAILCGLILGIVACLILDGLMLGLGRLTNIGRGGQSVSP